MPAYGIEIPYPEPYDHAQAMIERHDEHVRKSLRWEQIRLDFLAKIALAWLEGKGVLGTIVEQLTDTPIRDAWDLQGYLRHNGARDAKGVGQQLMRMLAETVLAHVEAIDDQTPFYPGVADAVADLGQAYFGVIRR
jgi:hypothetical protein